ncbi:50S ribosomal protein L16 [archaeon CG10_big_fil_rev_8_21_14_0_10_43_11]|nr:MAG: 50S ribosomal protein L16 [archaeon CG10_big_fil_rev_8_21_14_0_10_43_11]
MARLRSGSCYRTIKRPFTRKSKYRAKSFVRGVPNSKIVKFELGNTKAKFSHSVHLVSNDSMQVRHNALESARLAVNRYLTKYVGKDNYHLIIRVFPHHVLRENKLLAGAGADRFQSGMKNPYGKPTGIAAQVRKGQEVITVRLNEQHVQKAREGLIRASKKMPITARCSVAQNNN